MGEKERFFDFLEEGKLPPYTCPCSSFGFLLFYCQEQVTQENAMAKKLIHCVERTLK